MSFAIDNGIEKKQLESVVDVRSKGGPIKAKKGIGLPPATKYKKYLKGLKKATTTPLSGTSTGLPPKTARLLSQLKFAYKDRNTSKFLKRRFKLAGASSLSTSNLSTKALNSESAFCCACSGVKLSNTFW